MTIRRYNYIPNEWIYHNTKEETNPLYLGVELEIDKGGESEIVSDYITDKLGGENCYVMHDGSLNDGLEITTFPCSLNYHKSLCYQELFKDLVRKGYKSHNTTTCGLHVHVDRKYLGKTNTEIDLTIAKILYLMEKHWDNFGIIARRKNSDYANRYGEEYTNKDSSLFNVLTVAKMDAMQGYKYRALNLIHENSIEFRLFKGTLKYESFIATLEFVSNLVDIAKDTTIDNINSITFDEILNYKETEYLLDYYKERLDITSNNNSNNSYGNDRIEEENNEDENLNEFSFDIPIEMEQLSEELRYTIPNDMNFHMEYSNEFCDEDIANETLNNEISNETLNVNVPNEVLNEVFSNGNDDILDELIIQQHRGREEIKTGSTNNEVTQMDLSIRDNSTNDYIDSICDGIVCSNTSAGIALRNLSERISDCEGRENIARIMSEHIRSLNDYLDHN